MTFECSKPTFKFLGTSCCIWQNIKWSWDTSMSNQVRICDGVVLKILIVGYVTALNVIALQFKPSCGQWNLWFVIICIIITNCLGLNALSLLSFLIPDFLYNNQGSLQKNSLVVNDVKILQKKYQTTRHQIDFIYSDANSILTFFIDLDYNSTYYDTLKKELFLFVLNLFLLLRLIWAPTLEVPKHGIPLPILVSINLWCFTCK